MNAAQLRSVLAVEVDLLGGAGEGLRLKLTCWGEGLGLRVEVDIA